MSVETGTLGLVLADLRAVVSSDPLGIHPHRSDHIAVLLAEYDEMDAEIERLRAELTTAYELADGERDVCDSVHVGVKAAIVDAGLAPYVCEDDDLPTMVTHALAAARSAEDCEVRTEWSVRGPQGNVWQLYPASEAHARQRLRLKGGGELVTREVRSTAGPWTEAS